MQDRRQNIAERPNQMAQSSMVLAPIGQMLGNMLAFAALAAQFFRLSPWLWARYCMGF
jgi:hypothetical protein